MVKRFNLYKEGSFTTDSELKTMWLGPGEIKYIETKQMPYWALINELMSGNRCLGLIKDGEVLTYVWINSKFAEYCTLKIPLKKNECCLYNAITKPDRRGNGYAETLRAKCYDILRAEGKDTFYSFSDTNNKPAIRFKQKISAEFIDTYLYLKFWKFKYLKKL